MSYAIEITNAAAAPIASVVKVVPPQQLSATLLAGLDKIYALLRRDGVSPLGCNVGVYRAAGAGLVEVRSGVQTPSRIVGEGDVVAAETPAGRAATTVHWGRYEALGLAHAAVREWLAARGLRSGANWEVYGDWADDPAQRRTDVYYLLEAETAT